MDTYYEEGTMNIHTNTGGQSIASAQRPAAWYNLLSVAAPFVGVAAVLGFLAIAGASGHWYWTWRGGVAMAILASAIVAGAVLAFIALARSERCWGFTVVGLILNVPFVLLLLWSLLTQLDSLLRYGLG